MFSKKAFFVCSAVASMVLGSCVTTTTDYDFKKDLSLDMQIAPEGMSLPLGSLAKIRMDSLIKVKDDGTLKILDGGVFGISMEDDFQGTSMKIDPWIIQCSKPVLTPQIPEFNTAGLDFVFTKTIDANLNISSPITVNQKIDASLKNIEKVALSSNAAISILLKINDLPDGADPILEDFEIKLPAFLKPTLLINDAGITIKDESTVVVNRALSASERKNGLSIDLSVSELVFGAEQSVQEVDGKNRFILSDSVFVCGKFKLDCKDVQLSSLGQISVAPTVTISDMEVQSICGKFDPEIDPVNEDISLSLGKDLNFLTDKGNTLTLSDPVITLNLASSLTIPVYLDFEMSSKDSNGKYIAKGVKPDAGKITIPACPLNVSEKKTVLVISRASKPASGDTIFVQVSGLPELMKTIPESISFNMTPTVDKTVSQTVDIMRDMKVSGTYDVNIPFAFDNVNIEYRDTIGDMGKDLADIGDRIASAELKLTGNVESTIPLDMNLTVEPYDKNFNKINGITISSMTVSAGAPSPVTTPLSLTMKVNESGALKNLESLVISAKCTADNPTVLKKDQYLYVKDLVLKIPTGGLTIDLADKKDK